MRPLRLLLLCSLLAWASTARPPLEAKPLLAKPNKLGDVRLSDVPVRKPNPVPSEEVVPKPVEAVVQIEDVALDPVPSADVVPEPVDAVVQIEDVVLDPAPIEDVLPDPAPIEDVLPDPGPGGVELAPSANATPGA
jgi:hypothetical protein